MSDYEIVQCRVIWHAAIHHLNDAGQNIKTEYLGRFITKKECEQAFKEQGLVPAPPMEIYSWISKDYDRYGTVWKILEEI